MRQTWIFLVAGLLLCALVSVLPTVGAQSARLLGSSVPRGLLADEPPSGRLVEDTFYLTQDIEVTKRLLPLQEGVRVHAAHLGPGLDIDADGVLVGTPTRAGTYSADVALCGVTTCAVQRVTAVVLRNVPWEPRVLTFPGRVGAAFDGEIAINGGPSGVPPTFSVTDYGALPDGVSIGPDGHVGGVPVASGVSEVPVRVCVAGNCAGVVVTLIVV
ncbi:hypothetical protein ABZ297_30520 [Nonomuraea sp. NPDC005983]|uniref:hypothetical protein n=1 Tax=Nonomuraea sp. NPDC005983 TaxID=3155595 RepID=UPI0033AA72AC